nr:DUF4145 domain-containing protein [Hasllibacter sp. MH4015]
MDFSFPKAKNCGAKMVSIALDCPHCGSRKSAFELARDYPDLGTDRMVSTIGACGVCRRNILLQFQYLHSGRGAGPIENAKQEDGITKYTLVGFYPKPPEPKLAAHIPEKVSVPLAEAEECFIAGHFSAAGSCYRKAIERAVRILDSAGKGMLNSRIRKIEKERSLPKSLVDLLDEVRLFGNDAIHDDLDPTKEDCDAARDFADLFLTFTFSLPARIEHVRSKRHLDAE